MTILQLMTNLTIMRNTGPPAHFYALKLQSVCSLRKEDNLPTQGEFKHINMRTLYFNMFS